MSKPKIFLSAVSGQFRDCRNALASDLRAIGVEVVVQEDFRQHGWTLLAKLQEYIAGCDRVIALVGDAYGFEPAEEVPCSTHPRRSYTQWEHHFARGERLDGRSAPRKPTYVYFAGEGYLKAHPVEQMPEPAALQRDFIAAILSSNKDYQVFGSQDELRWKILRDVARVGEPAGVSSVRELPAVVIGLSRRGDTYVFRAAIRWWKGSPIEICKIQEIAPHDGHRLAQQVEFALGFATKVFCERPPILPLVVELVLSEDLLLEPYGRWKDRWTVPSLSASPNVKRLIHDFWPVRLRFAKHWDSGSIALKLGSRVAWLKGCPEEHFRVTQDLEELDGQPEGPTAPHLWAIVQDEKPPARHWWRDESVVCAAFTKRPQLERCQAVGRGSIRRHEAKPTPFLNAIEFGVPFLVWPNKQPAARQEMAEHLERSRRPSELCRYFHRVDPESFCVLDESCESPWPSESNLVAEVELHPGD